MIQFEEINQKVLSKEKRFKRYRERVKQYRQNRKFYQQVEGDDTNTHQQPDAREAEQFWSKIMQPREHKKNAECSSKMAKKLEGLKEGPKAEISIDLLRMTRKKIWNWKTPGNDGIHGFWFRKLTTVHDRPALEIYRCLQEAHVPEWITKGRTTLIQEGSCKVTVPNNYRPITCLSMM